MASARQKSKLAVQLGMFMFEQGKIMTPEDYKKFRRVPVRWATIRSIYGNWAKALWWISQSAPEVWKELQNLEATTAQNPEGLVPEEAPVIDLSAIGKEDGDTE